VKVVTDLLATRRIILTFAVSLSADKLISSWQQLGNFHVYGEIIGKRV